MGGEDGILIVRYPDGRASGDAFAIFEDEDQLEAAMMMNKSNLGSRYVEIYKSSMKEFRLVSVYMYTCRWGDRVQEYRYSGLQVG